MSEGSDDDPDPSMPGLEPFVHPLEDEDDEHRLAGQQLHGGRAGEARTSTRILIPKFVGPPRPIVRVAPPRGYCDDSCFGHLGNTQDEP